ncbi:MAG: hypothetical protein M3132_15560 [Actinomycetia bacterium]|nr:hypothetical protein [Actinomycetes bacterium]
MCSKYIYDTIRELADSEQIELFYLQNVRSESSRWGWWSRSVARIRARGLVGFVQLAFFKLVMGTERRILSVQSSEIRSHGGERDIAGLTDNDTVYLHPIFSRSGVVVRYPDEDIRAIESLNLDLILRGNAPGIFRGAILTVVERGIVSFHHGDNRWNRGGPPGFWEVYLRRPSTGFVVQILSEELDGGSVVLRGEIPTERTYAENLVKLYADSYPDLAKMILSFASSGHLPAPEPSVPYGGPLLVAPSVTQSIAYVLRTGALFSRIASSRVILRKRRRWTVAFVAGPWRQVSLRNGVEIENPPNRFFADPFLVERNGRTVCFVEDYSYRTKKGRISAIEISGDKRYEILGSAVDESFHMSFPFVFEYREELYMVPETTEANSIRLYRCIEFPMKWRFERELLSNVVAADPIVFEFRGWWWLFTTVALAGRSEANSRLMAYYSDDPVSGEWIPHEGNPLLVDSNIARNGGLLDRASNEPVRCRQAQGFNAYGASLSLAAISELSPTSFEESEIGQILPDFSPGLEGCHHLDSNGAYTVYDYVRRETLR